ncbi:MAG TPA: hypothetical protein VKU38_06115, partial [Ktedonobacteraceae bacterium]|nr:hypothetical protein [Ktedonobacteraceae bacterium]
MGRVGCVQDAASTIDADGSCTSGTHPYLQYLYDSDKIGGTSYPIGRLTRTIATTYYPDSGTPSASANEKYAYDTRGRLTTEQLLFNLPSAWNVTSTLPTYQMSYAYNDADQLYSSVSSTGVNGSFTTQYSTTQV